MARAWGWVLAAPLALMLTACGETGTIADDIGTLWGEESTAERERRAALEARRQNKVPVQAVRSVEIGRTSNGILITAFGTAPGLGYSLPALRVRRNGQPASDGYIEFDFVATAPAEGVELPPGTTRTRALRADLPVEMRALRGVRGFRVMALQGAIQIDF
jgi:hypothetical protein